MSIQKIVVIILLAGISTAGCEYMKNLQRLQEANARLEQMVRELVTQKTQLEQSMRSLYQEKNKISEELKQKIIEIQASQKMVRELKEQLAVALNDKNRLQKDLENYKAQAEEYKRKFETRELLFKR